MLANKLNYGDTIGVVGVANSLELDNRQEDFYRAEKLFERKGFKIKRGKYVLENYYGTICYEIYKTGEFLWSQMKLGKN